MRVAGFEPIELVLRGSGRVGGEPCADAADGDRGDLPQAASVPSWAGAPDLPVFAAKCGDCATRPGVVERHHVRADAAGLDVPDGGDGLSQGRPEIFNTDQGSQYTAEAFTGRLEAAGVAVSMDGRGRWLDNVFVERLWRTVKYELVYLHDYATPWALEQGLAGYFPF